MGGISVLECIKNYLHEDDDGVRRLPRDFAIQGNTCNIEKYYGEYTGSRKEWRREYSNSRKKKKADRNQTEDIIELAAEGFVDDAFRLISEYEMLTGAQSGREAKAFERMLTRAEVIYGGKNLAVFAKKLIMESDEEGDVYLGIRILQRVRYVDEDCVEALAILGSYLGLADSVCRYFREVCADADILIMKVASAQADEHRFYFLRNIEPVTEEIRHWFLFDALEVDEPDYYKVNAASLICIKLGFAIMLEGELTQEEFEAAGRIVRVLYQMDEYNEYSGASGADVMAYRFLRQCALHKPVIITYEALYEIREFVLENTVTEPVDYMLDTQIDAEAAEEILDGCKSYLESGELLITLKEALKSGRGAALARDLELPYESYCMEAMASDFKRCSCLSAYITEDGNAQKVLGLFRKVYPPELIIQGVSALYGWGDDFKAERGMSDVWTFLRIHPFIGMDYIEKGLNAKAWDTRRRAVSTVEEWFWRSEKKLSDSPRELYTLVNKAYEKEPCQDLRENLSRILENYS